MDANFNMNAFMVKYGDLLTDQFKRELNKPRLYSPGFTGRAYASFGQSGDNWKAKNKRDRDYSGKAPRSKMGTGSLSNSIESVYNPTTQQLGILMNDYWQVVNDGRKPGTYAPPSVIKDWIKTHTSLPESAAFAVNRNIFKFGITPNGFYGRAVESIAKILEKDFQEDFNEALEIFLNNLLEPETR